MTTYQDKTIESIVDEAKTGSIDIPEFQRAFVWDADKVAEFIDSICKGYPIGMFIFWERYDDKNKINVKYIVDGLQRITSMCLIFDVIPRWYSSSAKGKKQWEKIKKKYNIGLQIKDGECIFSKITSKNQDELCPVSEIFKAESLTALAGEYGHKWRVDQDKLADIFHELRREIKSYRVHCYIIPENFSDFAHVTEIFERINRGGVEVKISDIIVTRLVGSVWRNFKNEFDNFVADLINDGYITNAEMYRSGILQIFSAVASPEEPKLESLLRKNQREIKELWSKTRTLVSEVFEDVQENFGIVPKDLGDIKPFIILCRLYDKFGVDFKDRLPFVFKWFILRTPRPYGGFAPTMSDLIKIERAEYLSDAINELCRGLAIPSKEEIRENSFRSKRWSTLLKILCYKTDAHDFIEKDLKVNNKEIEKHHFFPRKIIQKYSKESADLLPNCIFISSVTNKKIGEKEPTKYLKEFDISDEDMMKHLLPLDEELYKVKKYKDFLDKRSGIIVRAIENYISNLEQNKNEINLSEIYHSQNS